MSTTARKARAENERVQANLETLDDLDFNVFSDQKWDEFDRSHAEDITVYWPDGRTMEGLDQQIENLQTIFVWAPDTRIETHPVKFGQGDWTAVIGYIEGTFTEPMPLDGGETLAPTGKAFRVRVASIAHWTRDGVMDEQYLFWDNREFMRQIGIEE